MPATESLPSIFAHRPFLKFFLARVFTSSGFQMQSVAVAWQVYVLTGSAMDLGWVGLAQFIPRLLFAMVSGNIADRYNRRLIAVSAQLVQALVLVMLAALSAMQVINREWILVLVFIGGTARTFEMPSTSSLLPSLVPEAMLGRAIATSASAMQAATVAGPALGGVLYLLGAPSVYAINTLLFLAAAFTMSSIHISRPLPPDMTGSHWRLFLDGLRFIRNSPVVLGAISLDLFVVLLGGATALLPIIAKEQLHTGAWGLGLLRSGPAIGALLTSLWLAHRPLQEKVGKAMFLSVAIFGVATIAFGLSHSLLLSLFILAVLGAADMVSVVIRGTLVQLRTPDAMRGRVSAVNFIFIGASNQLGEFESGVTAAWFGTVPAILLGGVGSLLVAGLWMRRFPALLQSDRMDGGESK